MADTDTTKLTDTKLSPGVYTLIRDVTNPASDARDRSDWRKQRVWKKGTTYVCVPEYSGAEQLEVRAVHGWLHQSIAVRVGGEAKQNAQREALFAALEQQHGIEADFVYFMAVHGQEGTVRSQASRLLLAALTEGKIDMAWLDETCKRDM